MRIGKDADLHRIHGLRAARALGQEDQVLRLSQCSRDGSQISRGEKNLRRQVVRERPSIKTHK
jgi:hypothetical protein